MRDLTQARRGPLLKPGALVKTLPPATRFILRGGPAVRAAAEQALALEVPASPCRAALDGERAALWLGPDEWLLLASEGSAASLAPALSAALQALPHSLVDVSHRQIALTVEGPAAETLLAAGCPLDLDARAFPIGMCTRTVLGKAEIVLWRTGTEAFRIEVWRSFAGYLCAFLAEAAHGIG
ncbi:MAG: sarcosine oxidase subunit gamma [Steroidobacterales bacterium]|jgi:sarcosine oxidase subunit gamma